MGGVILQNIAVDFIANHHDAHNLHNICCLEEIISVLLFTIISCKRQSH